MPTIAAKRNVIVAEVGDGFTLDRVDVGITREVGGPIADRLVADGDAGPVGWIEGRGGRDVLLGGDGADLLIAGRVALNDGVAVGVRGRDDLGDRLDGRGGDDLLLGADGRDRLFGREGNDTLYGWEQHDTIRGGAGDDAVHGGLGSNRLHGNRGTDLLSFADVPVRDRPLYEEGIALNLSNETVFFGFGATDFLIEPGRAARVDGGGTGLDRFAGFERYEGSAGSRDVAFLDQRFGFVGTDADGFDLYSDGLASVALRGFEDVFLT